MGRKLRKPRRLITAREPSGRPQRHRELAPSEVRRLRDAALCGLKDAEWGTELGRLYLTGAITETMYGAGKRWAEVASRYQAAIGIFPVRGPALERGARGANPDPDSDEGHKIARKEREAIEQFFAAHAVLLATGAELLVRRLCELNDAPSGPREYGAVKRGLEALAAHWALTTKGKSENGK